ncbi:tail completion protein gp17 [Paenibacillus azoreducens]|uniref:tail completion protein gp17 n=1 Tax=Paenibacillus azoreducens TaxID=116718 RepID=UPI0039F50834
MMIDLKPKITQALRSNAALISLLGRDAKGNVKVYSETTKEVDLPYVTFFELVNFDNKYLDDVPVSSDIHFHIDVFSAWNTGPIAVAVNQAMEDLGFIRTAAVDQNEKNTGAFHKILRYKTINYGS